MLQIISVEKVPIYSIHCHIKDYPEVGASTRGWGGANTQFCQMLLKLHKIETKWTHMATLLDPSLLSLICTCWISQVGVPIPSNPRLIVQHVFFSKSSSTHRKFAEMGHNIKRPSESNNPMRLVPFPHQFNSQCTEHMDSYLPSFSWRIQDFPFLWLVPTL